jgi:hypothetical protein
MPRVDSFYFGTIIVDGKKYANDIKITPDGKVGEKEKSHEITKHDVDEMILLGAELIIIGTGTAGAVKINNDAYVSAQVNGTEIVAMPTTQAVQEFNKLARTKRKVGAIFHLTC